MKNKFWFKAKNYGWGWYPSSWQGWLTILFYVITLAIIFRSNDLRSHSASDTLYQVMPGFILATLILLAICLIKGEKPSWRWGKKN